MAAPPNSVGTTLPRSARHWTGLPVLRLSDQPLVSGLDGIFSTFENQADVFLDGFRLQSARRFDAGKVFTVLNHQDVFSRRGDHDVGVMGRDDELATTFDEFERCDG